MWKKSIWILIFVIFTRGHGIYTTENNKYASVVGFVTKVNNLFLVQPIKSRYIGDIGDVVVGRITAVESNRWRVDINSTLDAMLPLTSVNLPGGELVIYLFSNALSVSFILIQLNFLAS